MKMLALFFFLLTIPDLLLWDNLCRISRPASSLLCCSNVSGSFCCKIIDHCHNVCDTPIDFYELANHFCHTAWATLIPRYLYCVVITARGRRSFMTINGHKFPPLRSYISVGSRDDDWGLCPLVPVVWMFSANNVLQLWTVRDQQVTTKAHTQRHTHSTT